LKVAFYGLFVRIFGRLTTLRDIFPFWGKELAAVAASSSIHRVAT
jgi:hypothetical protein